MEALIVQMLSGTLTPDVAKNVIYFIAACFVFKKENKKMRESLESAMAVLTKAVENHGTRIENLEEHVFKKEK
jgi:hypothetical protein